MNIRNPLICALLLLCSGQLAYGQNFDLDILCDFYSDTWQSISLPFASGSSYPSLAINESGYPSIAYLQDTRDGCELLYSEYDGTGWITTVVDSGFSVPSLAFTSEGTPLIAAGNSTEHELNLYTFDESGMSWTKSLVYQFTSTYYFNSVSLCIDNSDLPHIVWYLLNKWNMFYGYYDGAEWIIKDDFGDRSAPDLALDSNGNPYISHIGSHSSMSNLYCTFWLEGQWWTSIINEIDTYGSTSIDMSSDDLAHIVVYNGDLIQTRDAGPGWLTEVIDSDYCAIRPDIEIGLEGNIFVVYQESINQDLRFAQNTGSGWEIEIVDWEGNTGSNPSLALDSQGIIYIAYTSYESSDQGVEDTMHLIWFGPETGIEEEPHSRTVKPIFHPAFPNPAAGAVSLSFLIPFADRVELKIYDASGRCVEDITGNFTAGDHCMVVEVPHPGVYFCRMIFRDFTESQRFVVID